MRITPIIPAYNAGRYIRGCLEALLRSGFAAGDIVLVDDGSTDDTLEIAREIGIQPVEQEENLGAAAARNTGAAVVETADILLFVDADIEIHSDVKQRLTEFFQERPDYGAVFGAYDTDPAAPQFVSRARNLLHTYVHMTKSGDVPSFWTGIGAVRKSAFDAVGGFDASKRMMEDIDLGMRLTHAGFRIYLDPEIQGRHYKRWTLSGAFRTDLFDRAIPWATLLRQEGQELPENMLNIDLRARLSVLSVAAVCLASSVVPFSVATGATLLCAALVLLAALNLGFLRFVQSIDGWRAVPAAYLVLLINYFCGGLGFAWVLSGLGSRAQSQR